jgi:predicted nucleic acid-binding protein
MILADTCVWVDHLRAGEPRLKELLCRELVLTHPFILGELACGNLKNRSALLKDLRALPAAVSAGDGEVLRLIEEKRLFGMGIGWVDAHLLASALLSDCPLWTFDETLKRAADRAGVKRH